MRCNIEAERVRKGWTKKDLASELGVSLKTYYNWVNKEMDIPSSALVKMALFFGTDIDYLLKGGKGALDQVNNTKDEPEQRGA